VRAPGLQLGTGRIGFVLESGGVGSSSDSVSAPSVKRRREDDREKRRAQILKAATELFARNGLENVTFGDIAKRARLSRPLVYFYFPDQRAIFLEAVLMAHGKLQARFLEASARGSNGITRIENIGRAYVQFQREDPSAFQLCALYDANPVVDGETDPVAVQLGQSEVETQRLCSQAIAEGMADGSIRSDLGHPAHVAVVLWACVHGMAQLGAMRGPALKKMLDLDGDGLVEEGIRLLRRSLVPATKFEV
jgi:AcrR family transcriptional regulator